jgi:hypothetical protein
MQTNQNFAKGSKKKIEIKIIKIEVEISINKRITLKF